MVLANPTYVLLSYVLLFYGHQEPALLKKKGRNCGCEQVVVLRFVNCPNLFDRH